MDSNKGLIDYLKRTGRLKSDKVLNAFENVDRKNFVPENKQEWCYEDRPLSLGEGSTISAPHMVALNTETLNTSKEDKILEIGSGSGYQLAILAYLCSEVVGVEIKKDLVDFSRDKLSDYDNVRVLHGNGFEPISEEFDKILYSAAIDSFEPATSYVKDNGVILAPIIDGGTQVLKKWSEGDIKEFKPVRFVELRD